MRAPREQHRLGVHYLELATALLHRIRAAHPSAGLLEAANLQWWWRTQRSTDNLPQLFWFDHLDRPEAAVIATDWGDGVPLDSVRIKVCFRPDNSAARDLYVSVGFDPDKQTAVLSRRASARA